MANNIRIIRLSKGLSIPELAARMPKVRGNGNVSRQYLSQIERGIMIVSPDTLKRIAKALHVRVELLTQDGLKLVPARLSED